MIPEFRLKQVLNIFLIIIVLNGCASGPVMRPLGGVKTDNMRAAVQYLTSLNPPRSYEHPESLEKTADYISSKLGGYGLKPERQAYEADGKEYCNIIASVGPKGDDRLIIGAHYDVYGNHPGADGNASGIAGLLEIARLLKAHESELNCGVDIVAYTLGEPPFFDTANMGSYIHASSLKKKGTAIKGMICLEMIGFYISDVESHDYTMPIMGFMYPKKGDYIAIVSDMKSYSFAEHVAKNMKSTALRSKLVKAPSSLKGADFSDHRNYWRLDYNAVMITDTAFNRNPNYHSDSDTIDTLDFDRMEEVVKGVCWSVLSFSEE